jgi:isopenicillin N synthase-like dioxygenase
LKKLIPIFLYITSISTALNAQTAKLPLITLLHQELYSNSPELYTKLKQAARQGVFYLEISEQSQKLIPHAVQFANSFYKNDYLISLQLPGYSGYNNRENAQVESFYADQSVWQTVYPQQITELANEMQEVSEYITLKILTLLLPQLSTDIMHIATNGLLKGNGLFHFIFNHYRPKKKMVGLSPHRDFGYVTILYIDKPGLHAKIDGSWHPIPPREGYFVVNFGRTFEILVNDPNRLIASWHYVEQITHEKHVGDRISFGISSDNAITAPLRRLTHMGALEIAYANTKEFIDTAFKDLYDNPDLSTLV